MEIIKCLCMNPNCKKGPNNGRTVMDVPLDQFTDQLFCSPECSNFTMRALGEPHVALLRRQRSMHRYTLNLLSSADRANDLANRPPYDDHL